MEPRESQKIVPIKGKNYQVNKLDARTGCWLFSFMSEKSGSGQILSGLGKCTRPEFFDLQNLALKQVFLMDGEKGAEFPIPVVGPSGQFVGDLVGDVELAFRLTSESILFNLEPFLVVAGSNSQI